MEKNKEKSVKKNYLYNLTYQFLALITPLVTTPYVSRVLGSAGVGQYSFTFSIISYFCLFAAMGYGIYAQREIAKFQDDRKMQSKLFWEVLLARFIPVVIAILFHFSLLYFNVYGLQYRNLMIIQTLNIIAIGLDITFLFQGNEAFAIITIRNIVVKFVGVAAIFAFVKTENDVGVYTMCQSGVLIISSISLWSRLPKVLVSIKGEKLNLRRHSKYAFRLFIPTIAVSVYTMLDKTLIGILIPGSVESVLSDGTRCVSRIADLENGYYEQSEKLVKMASTVITSLGTVMIPRNSQVYASGRYDELKNNVNCSLKYVGFIGIPMMFGLAAISFNLSPWFFGPGFDKVPYLMTIFSPLIVIIGLTNVIGSQYMLPMGNDRKYTRAICLGAIINLVMNLILIRLFWSYGACVATIIAEITVMFFMFRYTNREFKIWRWVADTYKNWISGIIMFVVVLSSQAFMKPCAINTVLLTVEGMIIYLFGLFILRDELIKNHTKKFLKRFYHKMK